MALVVKRRGGEERIREGEIKINKRKGRKKGGGEENLRMISRVVFRTTARPSSVDTFLTVTTVPLALILLGSPLQEVG